jgi:phosphatidylserine/phosphatidylglycerophosphate/cardiolipin synthase-like enzyme
MNPTAPIARMDRALGEGLERILRAHHRRRLAKIGWEGAFDPGSGLWASGEPPPRSENDLEVLVDGAESFRAMVAALGRARSHVHIAGWHMQADFVLSHDPERLTLRELLTRSAAASTVRVLVWGGAPVPPPFRPRRLEARRLERELSTIDGVQVAIDSKERLLHCHHEKILIVDDEEAFVGGLDFSTIGASRLDDTHHKPRPPMGWHDTTVRIRGPLVADVADHFRMRWNEVSDDSLPAPVPPAPAGDVVGQIVRTVPEGVYDSLPRGDFRILEAYVRGLRSAQRFVYLENQFLWSSEIVKILAEKLSNPPTDDFRVVVVLPSKPVTGKDDTLGQLAVLVEADRDGNRFLACALNGREGDVACPVYIHAKVGIVDDAWLTIGSGNLNNHSLFNDSEVNVLTCDARLARETRLRLWSEHLEVPIDRIRDEDPRALVDDLWKPIAEEQLERRSRGAPVTHRLTRLPHVSKTAKRLLGPLQTLLVDG